MAAQKKYPDELRERAVKMVLEIREQDGSGHGSWAFTRRRCDRGLSRRKLTGERGPGTTTDDKRRIAELEREVRELRRANEILKAASAYFARELDPRPETQWLLTSREHCWTVSPSQREPLCGFSADLSEMLPWWSCSQPCE